MTPKPNLPTSLLRTYTSLLSRQTAAQWQASALRLLGYKSQTELQNVWRSGGIQRAIEGLSARRRVQAIPVPIQTQVQGGAPWGQRRWRSTDSSPGSKIYSFDDILAILETPSDSRLLIDVREPHEYEKNSIPTAINLPVTSQPDALLLSEEDFEDRFGFPKPPLGKEVVFFCKAGVRSKAAASIARQGGYKNVGEYPGSFLDWEKRGGPGTKTPPPPGGRGEPKLPTTETKPVRGSGDSGEEDLGPQGSPPYPKGPTTPRQ